MPKGVEFRRVLHRYSGDSINLRLGTVGFNGKLQLFSPYGELLDTTQDNTDDLITDIAEASGTYTVLVSKIGRASCRNRVLNLEQTPEVKVQQAGDAGSPLFIEQKTA